MTIDYLTIIIAIRDPQYSIRDPDPRYAIRTLCQKFIGQAPPTLLRVHIQP